MKKRILALTMAMALSFTGCGGNKPAETKPAETPAPSAPVNEAQTQAQTEAPSADTRVVKDYEGNEITIPAEVKLVSPGVNSMSQITAMLGAADRIVAAGSTIMANSDFFCQVFPDFKPEYCNENIEEVLASGAEVFYGPKLDEDAVKKYEEAGIAFVNLGRFGSIDEFMWTVTTIGDILGDDAAAKAKEFVDYFNNNVAALQAKADTAEQKVRVVALGLNEGAYSIGTTSNMQNSYLKAVGGQLFSEEWQQQTVNAEDLIAFDPEVIFCNKGNYDEIMNAENLADCSAIKNKRVYTIPYGTFGWGVNNAEAAGLAPTYYAKCMYPELFEDLDMVKVMQDFYKQFYSYDLTEEEANKILNNEMGGF